MPVFVIAIFLSAFLLFSVQPMIAKFLLPSFGGTAAVWATCLVFFQIVLLGGYAYAHLLRIKLSPIRQRQVHVGLLILALFFLPPAPVVSIAAATAGPVGELLRCLLFSIGIPFFALSATAPLLMEWFRQSYPQRAVNRLYAVSNAGSLLALLSYPSVLEPNWTNKELAHGWAIGMAAFALLCAVVVWNSRPARTPLVSAEKTNDPISNGLNKKLALIWIGLAACGTGMLLAITNQISQDVAPMPLLWVAPMVVYLATFILGFEWPRFYQRRVFLPACFAALAGLAWLLKEGFLLSFWVQVSCYMVVLFVGCMACHGELYQQRPQAEHLTAYYLCISVGGAAGGMFVALLSPVIFRTLLETPIIAFAVSGLLGLIIWKERKTASPQSSKQNHWATTGTMAGCILVVTSHTYVQVELRQESLYFIRNFYGVYRITESTSLRLNRQHYQLDHGTARILHSGQIYHGLQFISQEASSIPTTYYCEEGGLGYAFRNMLATTNRHIGIIGLGAGTTAAYGRMGDIFRFYEISPAVVEIARNQFTFLSQSPAKIELVLGDGRQSLSSEPSQEYDLLVLDAFTGDSVPTHLLTSEAMQIYVKHLSPNGLMVFHISNTHLDLEPIVRALTKAHNMYALLVIPPKIPLASGKMVSYWMLASRSPEFFRREELQKLPNLTLGRPPKLWTDDHSSIISILK
jgi:spermidine synthase